MKTTHFIFLIAIIFERGQFALAQNSNLIFNGNFEQWDTALYPLADPANTKLCEYYPNIQSNEAIQAYCIKGVDCVHWLPYGNISSKYKVLDYPNSPQGYKNCYNWSFESYFYGDTNYPRKGETFIMMCNRYDTIQNKYTWGKQFLYMPLIRPLIKGKTYQLDFDLKTGRFFNQNFYDIDTVEFYGSKGFGFGFTEQKPTFIQNSITYETDLTPKISIPYYNQKNWQQNTRYFTADSNYQYIIFGYFNDAKNTFVNSKTPYCQLSYPNQTYAISHIDNLFLQRVNDTLLPQDTTLCTGKSINIPSIQNKKLNWFVNGVLQASQAPSYTFTPTANTQIIGTDSIVSDTMNIILVPYPVFSITQTDTLCNEVNICEANPNTYTYTWQPDELQGNIAKLQGNNTRTIIANNKGCKDTLNFVPILGTGVCGTYYIPNAFSPNNDITNEVFGVTGIGIQAVEMQIFNQWGQLLYNGNNTWNGKYKDEYCLQGIYLYKIKLSYYSNNGKLLKTYLNGMVTLLK